MGIFSDGKKVSLVRGPADVKATANRSNAALERLFEEMEHQLKESRLKKVVSIAECLEALITYAGSKWNILLDQNDRDQVIAEVEKRIIPELQMASLMECGPGPFASQVQKDESNAIRECCNSAIDLCNTFVNKLRHNAWQSKVDILNAIEIHRDAIFHTLETFLSHYALKDRSDIVKIGGKLANSIEKEKKAA